MNNYFAKAQKMLDKTSAKIIANKGMNTVDVIMHWTDKGTLPADYHPSILSTHTQTNTEQTLEFSCFGHQVNHGTSTFTRFAEIKNGDFILDIPHTVNLADKPEPRFEIDGAFYTQQKLGKELAETWDTFTGNGRGTFRTIILKPAK